MRSSLLPLHFVSAWAATTAAPKLKVLCLHGYSQNGAVLRDRSGGFRKPFKKSRFELSYPDGLFGCTKDGEDEQEADADLERRAWWRGHAGQATYVGWDESHASLCELWEREQFDGIIGFSQGAAAAAMLCAELKPRFGIFVAGFVPNDQAAAAVLLAGVDPCGNQGKYGRPARPKRLIGRGWPTLRAAWGAIWRRERPPELENRMAQPSASWLTGGSSQCQSMPQAAPGSGPPRSISRLGRAGRPHQACFLHSPARYRA